MDEANRAHVPFMGLKSGMKLIRYSGSLNSFFTKNRYFEKLTIKLGNCTKNPTNAKNKTLILLTTVVFLLINSAKNKENNGSVGKRYLGPQENKDPLTKMKE